MTRVAILQSNYIPWKGYFDLMHEVDLFVFYDDVQYTTNDWRNRNRIKTAAGPRWLTIPVGKHIHRRVCDVLLPEDAGWIASHWRRLTDAYRTAPFFDAYRGYFEAIYLDHRWSTLSQLNQALATGIARDLLGLSTRFADSRSFVLSGARGDRVLDLATQVGADVYVSGPAARTYLHEGVFAAAGVEVAWKDYAGYPPYPQLHGAFRHDVTILDLLFQMGPSAPWHIWGWREQTRGVAA